MKLARQNVKQKTTFHLAVKIIYKSIIHLFKLTIRDFVSVVIFIVPFTGTDTYILTRFDLWWCSLWCDDGYYDWIILNLKNICLLDICDIQKIYDLNPLNICFMLCFSVKPIDWLRDNCDFLKICDFNLCKTK